SPAEGDGSAEGTDAGPGYGSAEGARSDAMILAHVAADTSRIDAVQIPRHTITDVPACDDTGHGASSAFHGMINSALNAGPACSGSAVEELTGVAPDPLLAGDFGGSAPTGHAPDGIP